MLLSFKVYAKKLQKASEKSLFSTVIFESASALREKENKAIITWKHLKKKTIHLAIYKPFLLPTVTSMTLELDITTTQLLNLNIISKKQKEFILYIVLGLNAGIFEKRVLSHF